MEQSFPGSVFGALPAKVGSHVHVLAVGPVFQLHTASVLSQTYEVVRFPVLYPVPQADIMSDGFAGGGLPEGPVVGFPDISTGKYD